jgi:hypothetical protein
VTADLTLPDPWGSATSLDDLGDLIVAWLDGRIWSTPALQGPPDPEIMPLADSLSAAARSGLLVIGARAADDHDGAWADALATDETVARLRAAAAGTPLVTAACRGVTHECGRTGWWFCPWKEQTDWWASRCPLVWKQVYGLWHVSVFDPEGCRSGRLGAVLDSFALASRVIS